MRVAAHAVDDNGDRCCCRKCLAGEAVNSICQVMEGDGSTYDFIRGALEAVAFIAVESVAPESLGTIKDGLAAEFAELLQAGIAARMAFEAQNTSKQ